MKEEKLFFENSKGDKLCGILTDCGKKTIVVYCHGFSSTKNSKSIAVLTNIFSKKGISSFRFDFFGHGESEGDIKDITFTEAADDLAKVVDIIIFRGFERIILYGSSFGGIVTLMYCSKSGKINSLVLKCPLTYDIEEIYTELNKKREEWKEKGYIEHTNGKGNTFQIGYSLLEDAGKIDYPSIEKIGIPVLIVHGDSDNRVPIEHSVRLDKNLKNSKLVAIKGANHYFSEKEHFDQVIKVISEFVTNELHI